MLRTILLGLFISQSAFAAGAPPIPLWPEGAPGEHPGPSTEQDITKPTDRTVGGKPLLHLSNINVPTLQLFSPDKAKNTGAAIVVFPGGGYRILAYDLEGTEVCEWLNRIGVTCALIKYRVPPHEGSVRYAAPLQDAQRAIRLVRSRAVEWGVDPARVGVLGFSAGGHLAAATSTNYDTEAYPAHDAADKLSTRPDFTVLVYPAYLTTTNDSQTLAPEIRPTEKTPPTFLVQAENDGPYINSSIFYYFALKNKKVPAELHLFAEGGHGYGLRPGPVPVTGWPNLVERWLHTIGVLK